MNFIQTINYDFLYQTNQAFILIFLNIYVYSLTLLVFFLLLFSTNVVFFKTLNEFKGLFQTTFFLSTAVFLFLSLAGLPPFLGFLGKFLIFVFIFNKSSVFFICLFFLFNCFAIYFYIQNLRFMITKKKLNALIFRKNKVFFNFSLIYLTVILLFFLVFGVFFLSDIFIFLSPFKFFFV